MRNGYKVYDSDTHIRPGADTLDGGADPDQLYGEGGNDYCDGGPGVGRSHACESGPGG